jgi:hypothetical protein
MSTGPKQFGWWRRREQEAAAQAQRGRMLSPQRLRALASAVIIGAIAWSYFYTTFGSHEIASLEEFSGYLRGEDLYRKYEVSRLTWDCKALRAEFDARHLTSADRRISRDGSVLVFARANLSGEEFDRWIVTAKSSLALGHIRKVEMDAMLVPAMMVRLFPTFRFVSGDRVEEVTNPFDSRCRQ